jgi:hypothetical protein
MFDVVIFSDTSLSDLDYIAEEKVKEISNLADIIKELPAKSAGAHRIKTEVRNAGYTCKVIDLLFYFTEGEISEVCKKYLSSETRVIGFSTTFWSNITTDAHRSKIFKIVYEYSRRLTGPKIVFGGTLADNFSNKIYADKTFSGFTEEEFVNYLYELTGKEDRLVFDFNKSTIEYNADDFVDCGESPVIEISRGCIFKCSFCAYPLNGKSKFDYIKDEEILKTELIKNYELHGITTYTFSDDTFNDSTYKMEYLHKIFTSLPFKIQFVAYARLDLLNSHREQVDLLKEMGLVGAFFGIETLNHQSGKVIGKGINPEKVKEFLYELKSEYWKNDINITIGLISGLPFETTESHRATLDWISNKDYCLVDRIRPAALSIPNPLLDKYPFKSEFQLNAPKYGFYWPNKDSDKWKNFSHEIKSQDIAIEMSREMYEVARQAGKVSKGNFGLPLTANIAKYGKEPKTLADIIQMPAEEHELWLSRNRHDMITGYVNNYKFNTLNKFI